MCFSRLSFRVEAEGAPRAASGGVSFLQIHHFTAAVRMQQKVSVETPQKHIPAVSRWLLHVCSKGGFSVLPRMLALTSLHSTPLMCIRQKFCSNPTRNRHSVQEMLGISVYHHWLQQQRKGLFYFEVSGVCILGGGSMNQQVSDQVETRSWKW